MPTISLKEFFSRYIVLYMIIKSAVLFLTGKLKFGILLRICFLLILSLPIFLINISKKILENRILNKFLQKVKVWNKQKSKYLSLESISQLEIGKIVLFQNGARVPADTLILNTSELINQREVAKISEYYFKTNTDSCYKL